MREETADDPLTNSQFATRLKQLPVAEPSRPPGAALGRTRRPLLSISLFVGMLVLSAVSLLRYFKQADHAEPMQLSATRSSTGGDEPVATAPVQRDGSEQQGTTAESSAEARQQKIMALVAEANRALEAADAPQAERLFGQVIALDEDNPRASYGLSRIRLSQGNLSGAEGWIQLAIRKRPRRAAYHAHYAEILERLGNHTEAREERLRAQGSSESDE